LWINFELRALCYTTGMHDRLPEHFECYQFSHVFEGSWSLMKLNY